MRYGTMQPRNRLIAISGLLAVVGLITGPSVTHSGAEKQSSGSSQAGQGSSDDVETRGLATAQISQSWAGWAQCELTSQAAGYSHGETHLWTITGPGTQRANMEIYPTTWTVSGNGSLQRVSGPTRVSVQWQGSGTLANVEIGFTRHLDRITFQRWTGHGPARGAYAGSETRTVNGRGLTSKLFFDVQQWTFPAGQDTLISTRISGSHKSPFNGALMPLGPGGAMGMAVCAWDFARGRSPSSPPPSSVGKVGTKGRG